MKDLKQQIINKMSEDNLHFGFFINNNNEIFNVGNTGMGSSACSKATFENSKAVHELLHEKKIIITESESTVLREYYHDTPSQDDESFIKGRIIKLA